MAANETKAEGGTSSAGTKLPTTMPRDTIKGWNDKRKSNNQILSSMVPFVQLIGVFDEEAYDELFRMHKMKRASVVFDDGTKKSEEYDRKYAVDEHFYRNIEEKAGARFINLYIYKDVNHGLNMTPINGIVMAEKVSQAKDPSGGIGITDLQVEYAKQGILGARSFVMRMTINDPNILDDIFEYTRLATFGSKFLIIYGWSNPEVIPGYDAAMSPPKLIEDKNQPGRNCMHVPIQNLGNGGYWTAGVVNVANYDFGFNEMV